MPSEENIIISVSNIFHKQCTARIVAFLQNINCTRSAIRICSGLHFFDKIYSVHGSLEKQMLLAQIQSRRRNASLLWPSLPDMFPGSGLAWCHEHKEDTGQRTDFIKASQSLQTSSIRSTNAVLIS